MKFKGVKISIFTFILFLACSFNFGNKEKINPRDLDVIVELKDEDYDFETREKIQRLFLNELNQNIGLNYRIKDRILNADNCLVLNISSLDFENIKKINLVNHISVDQERTIVFDDEEEDKPGAIELVNRSLDEMNVPYYNNGGENTVIAILDSSLSVNHEAFSEHVKSPFLSKNDVFEAINDKNFNAKTSIENCYINEKFPYVHDYGGDDKYGIKEDDDVFSPYTNHGNHVTSICAANGRYKGIAPEAQICFFKVFRTSLGSDGPKVTGIDSVILRALEDASILNVDAINMSLGNNVVDFGDSVPFFTISKLSSKGISVNISAGNNGDDQYRGLGLYGNHSTTKTEYGALGSYTYSDATIVGSSNIFSDGSGNALIYINNEQEPIYYKDQIVNFTSHDEDGNTEEINFDKELFLSSLVEDEKEEFEYEIVPNIGSEEDYKDINVEGKIALIKRGESTFAEKIVNATNHGAVAVIIYNQDSTSSMPRFDLKSIDYKVSIPCVSMNYEDGLRLVNNESKKIRIFKEGMSNFSSNGPTYLNEIGVDVVAPGRHVLGAINTNTKYEEVLDKYDFLNGTSMAAPNYTGAYALLCSEFKTQLDIIENNYSSENIYKDKLMSTAKPYKDAFGVYVSPRKQGNGLIDVESAINSRFLIIGNKNEAKYESFAPIENDTISIEFNIKNLELLKKRFDCRFTLQAPKIREVKYKDKTGKVATSEDLLLISESFNIDVSKSNQSFKIEKKLSEGDKEYLSNFDYGTYLEGYVILNSLDSEDYMCMPYLIYYGNYDECSAAEGFDFEKESDKIYESEILESFCASSSLELPKADFGSHIYGSTNNPNQPLTDIFSNNANFDEKFNYLDAYKLDGKYHIFTGDTDVNKYLVIQEFMNRDVQSNNVYLKNLENEKIIKEYYLKDNVSGNIGSHHGLFKTQYNPDLKSNKFVSHRSTLYFDITSFDVGSYLLEFEFILPQNRRQIKQYILHIGSKIPQIYKPEIVKKNNEEYVKLNFTNGYDVKNVFVDNEQYFLENSAIYVKKSQINKDYLQVKITTNYSKNLNYVADVKNIKSGIVLGCYSDSIGDDELFTYSVLNRNNSYIRLLFKNLAPNSNNFYSISFNAKEVGNIDYVNITDDFNNACKVYLSGSSIMVFSKTSAINIYNLNIAGQNVRVSLTNMNVIYSLVFSIFALIILGFVAIIIVINRKKKRNEN